MEQSFAVRKFGSPCVKCSQTLYTWPSNPITMQMRREIDSVLPKVQYNPQYSLNFLAKYLHFNGTL